MSIPDMTPEQREAAQARQKALAAMTPEERYDDAGLNLHPAQKAQIIERMHHMNPGVRSVFLKAFAGKSLRAAATAKCIDCMGWKRSEVANCTVLACPLYPYRR